MAIRIKLASPEPEEPERERKIRIPGPGKYHRNGRDTELTSAQSIADVTGRLRAQVLQLLREHPDGLTDDEGGALMGGDRLKFGRRRNELCDAGLVEDSGRRRLTPAGRPAIVWVVRAA